MNQYLRAGKLLVDRLPQADIYSRCAVGLGQYELKWGTLVYMVNVDEIRYGPALNELAFVTQRADRSMTMHQRTSGYSMEDYSYAGDADPSVNPTPIPTDGLLFKLAVCVGALYDRMFGGIMPDSDPIESPDPDFPFAGYCGI